MSDKNLDLRRDLLGIALFAAGAFLGVVVLMCYWKGATAGDYAGSFLVDKELIRWFGRPACLVLGVVACTLGARMFLVGPLRHPLRSLVVGGLCLALGTSILMGALHPDYGGVLGELIGAWTSATLTRLVGIPLGLVCVFVPVWFAWLRPEEAPSAKSVREPAPSANRSTEVGAGVTAEEAAELIPRRPIPAVPAPARPLDTREKAPIPTGAQALESTHEPPLAHPNQAPALPRRAAADPEVLGIAARADLADAGAAKEPAGKRPIVLHPVDELEEVGPALPLTATTPPKAGPPQAPAEPEAPPEPPRREEALEPSAERTAAPASPAPGPSAAFEPAPPPPIDLTRPDPGDAPSGALPFDPVLRTRPSWESADETPEPEHAQDAEAAGEEVEVDELPVDAYGTPLTLVEELRRDSVLRAAAAEEEALEVAPKTEGEPESEIEAPELVADPLDEEGQSPRYEIARAARDDDEDEDEDDEEPAAPREDDDEELRREAPLFAPSRARTEPEEQPAEQPEEQPEEDPEEEADDAPVSEAEPAEDAEPRDEPEVVLRPQAASAAPRDDDEPSPATRETTSIGSEEDELVYKAGLLFLERQRVAVSMLQREFALDFEQATRVLDRLQAAGLIGPYLGGQRRDILLTLDQWRRRALAR